MEKTIVSKVLESFVPRYGQKAASLMLFAIILTGPTNAKGYLEASKISLDLREVLLSEVLVEIEEKTSLKFFYKNKDIDLDRKVSIVVQNASIKKILRTLFYDRGISYTIWNKHIIIKKVEDDTTAKVMARSQKQEHLITGKVVDKKTGEVIPYCNVVLKDTYNGTMSNELGEFVITVDALPISLIFSHIGYQELIVTVSDASTISVELKPLVNELQEVVLIADGDDKYALELVKNSIEKLKNSTRSKYGRAMYRQKTKNAEKYVELSEIVYDLKYTSSGIEDWEIMEGRYALNKEDYVTNKNFTLLSSLMKVLQPDTDELIFPLHPDFEGYYNVRVVSVLKSDKERIAVINFVPNKNYHVPIFGGEVYIDTKTHDILKVTGKVYRDDVKLVKLASRDATWKNYEFSYEIALKKDGGGNLLMDHILVDQEFDYYKQDSLLFHVSTTSNLAFYSHYTPTSGKKLGGRFKKNVSDWEKLDKIGYNKLFWEQNPIVKRTPVEEEVIASFEKDNAFGSIFLNSRNQIALMRSDISQDAFIKDFERSINNYNNNNPIEKVYLHIDKDILTSGEKVWYSAYVTLGAHHEYSLASKVLHVDLIGPQNNIVVSQTQKLVEGKSKGVLNLPKKLPSGNYQLRSYTNWMRNYDDAFFFTKKLKIIDKESHTTVVKGDNPKLDVQFLPEGGYAVNNLTGIMAFKTVGEDGLGKSIKGSVVDSNNKPVAFIKTLQDGAGFFPFKPKAGEKYTALLDNGISYEIPKALDEGYVITARNNKKTIKVKVQASEGLQKKSFYIVGHVRNKKYYQGKFKFGVNPVINFEISKTKIPSGVMTLTLFDEDKKPWCERLVFVNNQEELVIHTELYNTNRTNSLKKRDSLVLGIKVTDTEGRPVSANLSVAVTDVGQVVKDRHSKNILTYLLLESEIKGHIEKPALLFENSNRNTIQNLDLVMLTHGWRKFNWREIWDPSLNIVKTFPFAKGLPVSGTVKGQSNRALTNSTIKIFAKSKTDVFKSYTTKTDDKGVFLINDLNLNDSIQIAINAYDHNERPIKIRTEFEDRTDRALPLPRHNGIGHYGSLQDRAYLKGSLNRRKEDSIFNFKNVTRLNEVVVTQKRVEKEKRTSPSAHGVTPDATVYMKDSYALDFIQLLARVPGVRVIGAGDNARVSIRGGGAPLWVLDGFPVSTPTSSIGQGISTDSNKGIAEQGVRSRAPRAIPPGIKNLNPFDVERMEVIKGASASFYGSRAGDGVILVYTKKVGSWEASANVDLSHGHTIFGHAATKEFYSPQYGKKQLAHNLPDHRATLYWNPSITTDGNGKALVPFFNSDIAKEIQVDVQGLSVYGIPGASMDIFGEKN